MNRMLLILILGLLLIPAIAWAMDCSRLSTYSARLCNILNNIAGVLYVVAGGLALVVILTGGITIMVAGGSEDRLNKGKKTLLYGLIGAAVVLCAGFILDLLAEFLAPLLPPPS